MHPEFQERLKSKPPHHLIYVDEAGIDNRDEYPYGYCEIGQRFYALKSGKRTKGQLDCSFEAGKGVRPDDV